MIAPSEDAESFFDRYSVYVLGVGLVLAVVLGIIVMRGSGDDADTLAQPVPPPIPKTGVESVENEILEQVEVDYDASLEISTATAAR